MPPSQPAVSPDPNALTAVASQKAQNPTPVASVTADNSGAAAQQSGLAAATAAPVTKQDRLSSILKGIAAIAAEVGPEFIHSTQGTAFLGAGELALQILGEIF